eukprot:364137-Chlamydomonas_euryale.AAC.12
MLRRGVGRRQKPVEAIEHVHHKQPAVAQPRSQAVRAHKQRLERGDVTRGQSGAAAAARQRRAAGAAATRVQVAVQQRRRGPWRARDQQTALGGWPLPGGAFMCASNRVGRRRARRHARSCAGRCRGARRLA